MTSRIALTECSAQSLIVPWRERIAAAVELAAVMALLEVGMWQLCGPFNNVFRIAAAPLVAAIAWRSHTRRKFAAGEFQSHMARDTALRAWAKSCAVTCGLAALIPLVAILLRVEGEGIRWFWMEKGTRGLAEYVASKGGFIVVQQLLLQYFLGPCCAEMVPQRQAARCFAAVIFGLVHLPSLLLAGVTTLAAYCWLGLFARGRRILPLAVSHLLLAILAHASLPERLTLNMRVGAAAREIAERYRLPCDAPFAAQFQQLCSDGYFAACGGANDDFIRGLYRDLLGRAQPASDAEVAAWRLKLAAHARADVVVEFFNSQEFAQRTRAIGARASAQQMRERLARAQEFPQNQGEWR